MFPLENDAVVLGLLAVSLAGIFYAAQQPSIEEILHVCTNTSVVLLRYLLRLILLDLSTENQ